MKNSDKFKTAQERENAFWDFCEKNVCLNGCPLYKSLCDETRAKRTNSICHFAWLDLEAEEEKPLPCPCCGADAEIHYEDDVEREGDASVQCKGCFLMTPDYPSDVEAVMAWNKRMSNQERK